MLDTNRSRFGHWFRVLPCAAAWALSLSGAIAPAGQPATGRTVVTPAARRTSIVDRAVVPAGGTRCRNCDPGSVPLPASHLNGCRDGLCAPHCPVRPSQYGFYRTEWRRWPGQGVAPVSAEEAATPVQPPPVQVPTAEEESPLPPVDEPTLPGDVRDDLPTEPIPEPAEQAVPEGRVEPTAPPPAEPATEPASGPPVPPTPPGEPPLRPETGETAPRPAERAAAGREQSEELAEAGAMRYPAPVARSVTAGSPPWRLQPAARQRAAESARGL